MTTRSSGSFRIVVGVGWLMLVVAAAIYASLKAIPYNIAVPVGAAFLVEYPFYLLPGFATARDRFAARGKARAAAIFAGGAIAPWLIYTISTGHFDPLSLCVLCVVTLVMCFWYVVVPARPAADAIYLALFGALLVFKVFVRIYPRPMPRLDVSVLGHLMLIRVAAFSLIAIRGTPVTDYRFLPSRREFLAGLRWFAVALPVTALAYWGLGLVTLRPQPLNILLVVASFFGILWVVSLSEEFIFRGLLQPWIEGCASKPLVAVLVTSLIFGSVHLGFHGAFPNWRFSIVAGILGLFCGLARRRTGGIQAGMVTHALIVAVWMMFLK